MMLPVRGRILSNNSEMKSSRSKSHHLMKIQSARRRRSLLQETLLIALFGLLLRATSVAGSLTSEDVMEMIEGLQLMFKDQSCAVLGAQHGTDCEGTEVPMVPGPSRIVSDLSDDGGGGPGLYTIEERNLKQLLNDWVENKLEGGAAEDGAPEELGLAGMIVEKNKIVEELTSQVEEIVAAEAPTRWEVTLYNETLEGPVQSNWQARQADSGIFEGQYVDMEVCAYHHPSTQHKDRGRVDRDIMHMHGVCDAFKQNLRDHEVHGISHQFISSLSGVTLEYPASIRGLAYDSRFDEWFKRAISAPKDLVIVVDKSGSMEGGVACGAMTLAEAQVQVLMRSFVTPQDQVQLMLVAEEPTVSPCFDPNLVTGSAENVNEMLNWFYSASRERGGRGSLINGLLEALNFLEFADTVNATSGGGKYLVVISDALQIDDIVNEGLHKYAADKDPPLSLPMEGLHFVGITVGDSAEFNMLDNAACSQKGLGWKLFYDDSLDMESDLCPVEPVTVTTRTEGESLRVDPQYLLNATLLPTLSAFPFSYGSSVHWGPIRAEPSESDLKGYRTMMTLGKPFYDRSEELPKLMGAVGADFILDSFLNSFTEYELPTLTHSLLLQHKDDVGLCVAHSSDVPDYSDYVEIKIAGGDLNVRAQDFEGDSFSSILEELRTSAEGQRTSERRLLIDLNWVQATRREESHTVREDIDLVTYWWKRVPDTVFTIVLVVEGRPLDNGNMILPSLGQLPLCPESIVDHDAILAASGNSRFHCWIAKYSNWPSLYHRFDLSLQSMGARFSPPWGGVSVCGDEWCTYDTSAWVAMPLAFKSKTLFQAQNETTEMVNNLNTFFQTGSADGPMPGKGLRSASLAEVKISSNFERFWKEVLGVQAAGLDPTRSDLRSNVKQLFFLSTNGVLRFYPGGKLDTEGQNLRRSPWYTMAIANPDLVIVTTPHDARYFNSTSWLITVSRTVLHPQPPGVDIVAQGLEPRDQIFGVVGVQYT